VGFVVDKVALGQVFSKYLTKKKDETVSRIVFVNQFKPLFVSVICILTVSFKLTSRCCIQRSATITAFKIKIKMQLKMNI
jgi:hypothetical protein